jgi:hypothetical protein
VISYRDFSRGSTRPIGKIVDDSQAALCASKYSVAQAEQKVSKNIAQRKPVVDKVDRL